MINKKSRYNSKGYKKSPLDKPKNIEALKYFSREVFGEKPLDCVLSPNIEEIDLEEYNFCVTSAEVIKTIREGKKTISFRLSAYKEKYVEYTLHNIWGKYGLSPLRGALDGVKALNRTFYYKTNLPYWADCILKKYLNDNRVFWHANRNPPTVSVKNSCLRISGLYNSTKYFNINPPERIDYNYATIVIVVNRHTMEEVVTIDI